MTENTSWLKKPSSMLPRVRNIPVLNASASDTINMLNPNQNDNVLRPPKRKSCMAFKRRSIAQVPSEKKAKPNIEASRTEFRNRTLKMVQGQRYSTVRPGPSRLSNFAKPAEHRITAPSPLHKSTPCNAPRSILKLNKNEMSASKRVNFDNFENGICALQESTIQDFTQYDFRRPTKVDAGTNTDEVYPEPQPNVNNEDKNNIYELLIKFKKDILDEVGNNFSNIITKIDALADNVCPCKTPEFRYKTNQVQQYGNHLSDIREVDENTPVADEQETGESVEKIEPEVQAEPDEGPSRSGGTEVADLEKENVPENIEVIEEVMDQAISNSFSQVREEKTMKEKNTNVELNDSVSSSGNERKTRSSKLQLNSPAMRKLRNLRQRNIPRYLQSFEMSPKSRRGPQKE